MLSQDTKAKFLFFMFVLVVSIVTAKAEFSGSVSVENRYFPTSGAYGNSDKTETSLIIKPEYSHSWDDDRKVLTFIPYAIVSDPDIEKTHFDIREASIVSAFEIFEIRAGISKVYWGVTESQHLVDIINQSDTVINTDGEDKLGQPMLNFTLITDYGNTDFFILPFFRERTFPGNRGRFRTPLLVDIDNPLYEDGDKENHIDFAARYTNTFGNLDLGASIFRGTDREPLFIPKTPATSLVPYYVQTNQFGLDLQYVYKSWLLKFEGIHKTFDVTNDYSAATYGFEYTFSNIKSSGVDIGVLVEHSYDDRSKLKAAFYNHTFLATRIALNDEKSTEFLGGVFVNNDTSNLASLRVESSRRINENWTWEAEASAIISPETNDILTNFKDDDYAQISLNYYF